MGAGAAKTGSSLINLGKEEEEEEEEASLAKAEGRCRPTCFGETEVRKKALVEEEIDIVQGAIVGS